MRDAANAIIADRYRLDELIDEGAMGTVWRATHLALDCPVAIKFLHNFLNGPSPEVLKARFFNEARMAASVRHRNVVDIIDFGTVQDGRPYMVLEFLEGQNLADRLEKDSAFTVSELVRVADQALSGLAAIHDGGIIHRDLKPANIYLVYDADGFFTKLLDFGISRSLDTRSPALTLEGAVLGTPQYMSPEQAYGSEIDARTDIYSMGVVLYEALTGRLPYDANTPTRVILQVTTGGAAPVASFRPELEPLSKVVERAMALDSSQRFANARQMRQALQEALAALREEIDVDRITNSGASVCTDRGVSPRVVGSAGTDDDAIELPRKRLPSQAGVAVVSALVFLAIVVVMFVRPRAELEPEQPPAVRSGARPEVPVKERIPPESRSLGSESAASAARTRTIDRIEKPQAAHAVPAGAIEPVSLRSTPEPSASASPTGASDREGVADTTHPSYPRSAPSEGRSAKPIKKASSDRERKAEALFRRGQQAYRRGDYARAVVLLERAARRPTNPRLLALGLAYAKLGRNSEARRAWARVLETDPYNDKAMRYLKGLAR